MTVSFPSDNRWSYSGNGETTEFSYTSRIFAVTDLRVYINGLLQSHGSDYSVTGVGNAAGGKVAFATTPASGAMVTIVRDVPPAQALDLAALGSFPAEENEKALDRLTILVQQLVERQLRALRQPDGDPTGIAELPAKAARAGRLLAFDGEGNPSPGAVGLPATLDPLHYVRVQPSGGAYELRSPDDARADLGAHDAGNLTEGALDPARLADGGLPAAKLASGAVVAHLGFTPLNRAGDTMTGGLNMQAAITLAADPGAAMHAATKQYVDSVAAGLGKRGTVRATTIADHPLAGLAAVDGVTPTAGDLILVKDQVAAATNGVYVAASGVWSRAPLFDSWGELIGSLIAVQEGASQADTLWLCTSNSGGTLDEQPVLWSQVFPGSGGTVTNIVTAGGITGGPITSTGTIELDIDSLAEDAAPDLTADFIASYDVSAVAHRKVRLQNIGGMQIEARVASFTAGTTPNTVYAVSDTSDVTLPSAGAMPSGFRLTVKNTTDGKGVRILADGSDTIDGLSSFRVPGREAVELTRGGAGEWLLTRRPSFVVGQIVEWTTDTLPEGGWVWANGQALSRTIYTGLFDVWGTLYGPGDGSTTFNVRDDRGRVKAGKDNMGGASGAGRLTSGGSGINGAVLGAAGGSQTHTLNIAEMPSHSHTYSNTNLGAGSGGTGGEAGVASFTTGFTGGGGAHNNTQPTITGNFVVKT